MADEPLVWLIDGRPVDVIDEQDDPEGSFWIYRRWGETATHWLRVGSHRARAPRRWRD